LKAPGNPALFARIAIGSARLCPQAAFDRAQPAQRDQQK